jgi:hypothetical protein
VFPLSPEVLFMGPVWACQFSLLASDYR